MSDKVYILSTFKEDQHYRKYDEKYVGVFKTRELAEKYAVVALGLNKEYLMFSCSILEVEDMSHFRLTGE